MGIYLVESESLASQIFELQAKYNFPGLISELRDLLKKYELPNIIDYSTNISKERWKQMVKRAVRKSSEGQIKKEFRNFSKLRNKGYEEEDFALKSYITNMNLRDARTKFRLRSSTIPVKFNMKSDPKFAAELWKCDSCFSIESQDHIIWYPAYAPLRVGKSLNNDQDIVKYFQAVMKIRDELASQ